MKLSYIAGALLLLSSLCNAEESYMGFGIGIFNDASIFPGQNKYGEIGYRSFMFNGIYLQGKLGYWGEDGANIDRSNGFWTSLGPGLEVDLQPVEIRAGWSLAAISNPDSQLGGYFPQFNGEFYIGLRDNKGDGVGFQYEHISSAGLATGPNLGRDFVILQLSQKW